MRVQCGLATIGCCLVVCAYAQVRAGDPLAPIIRSMQTTDGPGKQPTDGLKRIEVYDNREAAEKAGVDFD